MQFFECLSRNDFYRNNEIKLVFFQVQKEFNVLFYFLVNGRLMVQQWCTDNGFELVEMKPDEDSDIEG